MLTSRYSYNIEQEVGSLCDAYLSTLTKEEFQKFLSDIGEPNAEQQQNLAQLQVTVKRYLSTKE